jgi:predicted deacetylase
MSAASRIPPPGVGRSGSAWLAVALHDVEPRSFARSREIRDWLADRDVERATLLVIPAADLHPIGARAPELAAWIRDRVAHGDAVAQHGLVHRASGTAPWPRSALAAWQGGPAAEFPGLDREDAARRVITGRRLLRDIEVDPRGFVAPGYAYSRALREILAESHEWFADLRAVRTRHGDVCARALCLGSSTKLKRALSPRVVRAAARGAGEVMRVDIHPADFDHPSHVATLVRILEQASVEGRTAVTYDDLSFSTLGPGAGVMGTGERRRAGAGVGRFAPT